MKILNLITCMAGKTRHQHWSPEQKHCQSTCFLRPVNPGVLEKANFKEAPLCFPCLQIRVRIAIKTWSFYSISVRG